MLLFGDDGKIGQWLSGGGVDKAVRMAFGAVVALAGTEYFFAVVIKAAGLSAEDVDYLAAGVVAVVADGAAGVETAEHDFVHSVGIDAGLGVTFAALEVGHDT